MNKLSWDVIFITELARKTAWLVEQVTSVRWQHPIYILVASLGEDAYRFANQRPLYENRTSAEVTSVLWQNPVLMRIKWGVIVSIQNQRPLHETLIGIM